MPRKQRKTARPPARRVEAWTSPPLGVPSRASIALRAALSERGAQRALTRALGCGEGAVNHWLTGFRRPNLTQARYLKRKFAIPLEWWVVEALSEKAA